MKFPTFLAVFLLATIVVAVPFVSAAVERDRDDRTRPSEEAPVQPPREETPDRDEESEAPRGDVVYNKNGVVVQVEEDADTTIVTVSIDGKIASKVTHTGSTDGNNGGDDSAPGEDGEDGADGSDNSDTPADDNETGEEDDRGREERQERVR